MDDDVQALREALVGRIDDCWARLEDAVSELVALHNVAVDSIVERVAAVAEGERSEGVAPPATHSDAHRD